MKAKRKLQKKNERLGNNSIWLIFGVGLGIVLIIIAAYLYVYTTEPNNKNAYQIYGDKEVPANVVCMKGDLIKSSPTIRVEIHGKSYQVCCEKCENKLMTNINYRYATDPYTNKNIDKANSYIVLDPSRNGKVIYFETEDNYQEFKKLNSE